MPLPAPRPQNTRPLSRSIGRVLLTGFVLSVIAFLLYPSINVRSATPLLHAIGIERIVVYSPIELMAIFFATYFVVFCLVAALFEFARQRIAATSAR